ncbi:DUF6064 family protein [Thalassospira sp. TSL5-1]|uniref:DUF6064 family protein n=1 Tax=Thalassospira sp. TSL5-1 TaxID=1544451 RepID=UPI00093B633B|nr:DUF6064 family protein [Thalassospira sp. TSL5-1]
MTAWWDYNLIDFLLFSTRVYYRLFESFNTTFWPVNLALYLAGAGLVLAVLRNGRYRQRVVPVVLALMWAWSGSMFMWHYYRPINWAVPYVLPVFAFQTALLVLFALRPKPLFFAWRGDFSSMAGMALLVLAIPVYPFFSLLAGRDMISAELFGSAPDPTIIGTLGFLLLARGTWRWLLLPVPVLWCLITSLTLWAMNQPVTWLPVIAAWLSVLGGWMDAKNGVTRKPPTREAGDVVDEQQGFSR